MPIQGGCHCGNIRLDIELSAPPSSFQIRICDCDFCRQHDAGFISDARGSLAMTADEPSQVLRYRQGSSSADFLICKKCGVFVADTFQSDGHVYAAANYRAITGKLSFGGEIPVSPKLLSASAKADRWKNLWFRDVSI